MPDTQHFAPPQPAPPLDPPAKIGVVQKNRIPIYQPELGGNEKRYVTDCLDTNWISSRGKYVTSFESAFGELVGSDYCTSVCNGTAALQTAIGALGIGPGDEVIVPSFTYIASVNPIAAAGAKPVFVDCDPQTWQADPDEIQRAITPLTKAIIVVHLYGGMCDMHRITAIAEKHRLLLIEDCAEALGSRFDDKPAGGFGDIATFSFYGNKTITTGEGGMVVCRGERLHQRVALYKGQGLSPHTEYWHESIGFNYRMTNICAAIGLAQLERIDDIIRRKRQLAQWYRTALDGLPVQMQAEPADVFHSHWMVSILCKNRLIRDDLRQSLTAAGIETRPLFPPVHTMPMYNKLHQELPHSESLAARGLNLPSWPALGKSAVLTIADAIRSHFAGSLSQ